MGYQAIIDATAPYCVAYKPNLAFYESRGIDADAHIGPAEQTAFTEIYGEFAASQRADVGIGPYEQVRNCIRIRLRFPLKQLHSAGQSRGPSLPTHSFLERSAYDLPV